MRSFSSEFLTVHVEGRVLRFVGEADLDSRLPVTEAFALLESEGGDAAVLDLSEVTFIESTILSILVQWGERFGGRSTITVRGATGSVLRTIEVTDLDRWFTMEPEPDGS